MNSRLRLRTLQTPLLAVALFAAGSLLASAPVSAGPPSPHEVHREIHGHLRHVLGGVHDALSVLASIPVMLDLHVHPEYEVYLGGQEYYGPHGHYHPLYRFPIWVDGAVVYRPQVYCGGRLFVAGGGYAPYYGPDRYRYQGYRDYRSYGSYGSYGSYRNHGSYQSHPNRRGDRYSREYRNDRGSSSYRSHSGQSRGNARYGRDGRDDRGRSRQAVRGSDSPQRHSGDRGRDRGQGRR